MVADGDGRDRDLAPAGHHRHEARKRDRGPSGLISAELLDRAGNPIPVGGGFLAMDAPWPAMLRTIWGDDARYVETYFTKWAGRPDLYFAGDGAKRDDDGYFWILGRVVECAQTWPATGSARWRSNRCSSPTPQWPKSRGRQDASHDIKGQALAAFVTLRVGQESSN